MKLRPHATEFLQSMARNYEVCDRLPAKARGRWTLWSRTCRMSSTVHVSDPTFCPQLFVYTCAKRDYAEKILNILDPQRKVFRSVLHHMTPSSITQSSQARRACCFMTGVFCLRRHRLYQEDCVCVLGHYIKDLSILGRDLNKTVVLDNMPHTYPYHVSTECFIT